MEASMLSRSAVFERLGSLLSDVSTNGASTSSIANPMTDASIIEFDSSFAHVIYRQDLSTIEHVHIRCCSVATFDASLHTSLCEAVLGIYPDTSSSRTSSNLPVLVRGVIERRHRRIKAGDWLLAINDKHLHWYNLNDTLSKYHSTRKIRLTIRHPISYQSTCSLPFQTLFVLPKINEKRVSLPTTIDCIHAVLYYEKQPDYGFKLLYQQPKQKDIFFAVGGLFPTLTQLMHDMNEHDSPLRRFDIG
jgi:hypothetical protein